MTTTFYSKTFLQDIPLKPPPTRARATTPCSPRPQIRLHRRGRRLPVIHLGGNSGRKKPAAAGFFLTRLVRRARLKWSRLSVFRKLKKYYKALIKDIIEASATAEAYQQRMYMESSLVSVPGISFSNFHGGSTTFRNPRSIVI